MARSTQEPESFESIADALSKGADTLREIAAAMRESGMPQALVHGAATRNTHLPTVLDWIENTSADVKNQIRAYLAGVQSSAELMKQKTENQKRATGKKKPPNNTSLK